MAEIKEAEEAIRIIQEALKFLATVKVKAEWPIPVKKDRQGKLASDYTLMEWHLKEQEETAEALDVALCICGLDKKPSETRANNNLARGPYLEEECDKIHTIFSKLHQFGFTDDEIADGIRRSNEKARERGLID